MNEIIQLSEEQHRYLQLNELQLLVEVDRICRKYNIDYSLDGGTLLGAGSDGKSQIDCPP